MKYCTILLTADVHVSGAPNRKVHVAPALLATHRQPSTQDQSRTEFECPHPDIAQPLHRLFQNDMEHYVYTTSDAEKQAVMANDGFDFDGIVGRAFTQQEEGTHAGTGCDAGSGEARGRDMKDMGVAAFVFRRSDCSAQALYRHYNPLTKGWFLTMDRAESEDAVADKGYDDAVIAAWIYHK
ncbi:hypothetical protein C8F01DRAFT_1362179 [Mycena amicta]|nr:hypothetical protein C8F01DRAFT_1362179 [Mycena amicta]